MAEQVWCDGYQMEMSPWRCIQNQLSEFCLPGWPCHTCPEPVTIGVVGKPVTEGEQKVEMCPKKSIKGMSLAVARALGLI